MSIELTFPEDYSREELINGEVVLMAPALPPHVRISGNIFGSFLNYLKDKKCAPIADGVTVFLSDTEHYVVLPGQNQKRRRPRCAGSGGGGPLKEHGQTGPLV